MWEVYGELCVSGLGGAKRRYLMWDPRRGLKIVDLQSLKERFCYLLIQIDVGWMGCLGIGGRWSDGGGRFTKSRTSELVIPLVKMDGSINGKATYNVPLRFWIPGMGWIHPQAEVVGHDGYVARMIEITEESSLVRMSSEYESAHQEKKHTVEAIGRQPRARHPPAFFPHDNLFELVL